MPLSAELLHDWKVVRADTIELLSILSDEKLAFCPEGDHWQPLSYQFACIGRTQLVYAWALDKGEMGAKDFSSKGLPILTEITTEKVVFELLDWADKEWIKALGSGFDHVRIASRDVSISSYVARLSGHERLHHGQIISYFTLAGYSFPKHFKQNWAL